MSKEKYSNMNFEMPSHIALQVAMAWVDGALFCPGQYSHRERDFDVFLGVCDGMSTIYSNMQIMSEAYFVDSATGKKYNNYPLFNSLQRAFNIINEIDKFTAEVWILDSIYCPVEMGEK